MSTTEDIDTKSKELMAEFKEHLTEFRQHRSDAVDRNEVFQAWVIQKIAALQVVILDKQGTD